MGSSLGLSLEGVTEATLLDWGEKPVWEGAAGPPWDLEYFFSNDHFLAGGAKGLSLPSTWTTLDRLDEVVEGVTEAS